eukprot:COSAG01_NODE_2874_length_6937_cov_4.473823_5_plen_58_part_00
MVAVYLRLSEAARPRRHNDSPCWTQGMAETTRGYLDNINQDGVTLPEGPVSEYGRQD